MLLLLLHMTRCGAVVHACPGFMICLLKGIFEIAVAAATSHGNLRACKYFD
jgi:hypothetical protein